MTTCTEWKCRMKAKWIKKSRDGLIIYYFCNKHKRCAKRYAGERTRRIVDD